KHGAGYVSAGRVLHYRRSRLGLQRFGEYWRRRRRVFGNEWRAREYEWRREYFVYRAGESRHSGSAWRRADLSGSRRSVGRHDQWKLEFEWGTLFSRGAVDDGWKRIERLHSDRGADHQVQWECGHWVGL